eukprot:GHVP01059942.1.p1 GENE.GHVP01059942.1~~GHVP01059942.1.p1  ORF type:complete len:492 (-),score=73.91 GHVP01059942.1:270-1568(-)
MKETYETIQPNLRRSDPNLNLKLLLKDPFPIKLTTKTLSEILQEVQINTLKETKLEISEVYDSIKIVGVEKLSGALIISRYDKKTQVFEMEICAPQEFHHLQFIEFFKTGEVSVALAAQFDDVKDSYMLPKFEKDMVEIKYYLGDPKAFLNYRTKHEPPYIQATVPFAIENPVLHEGPWLTQENEKGKKHLFSYGGSAFMIAEHPEEKKQPPTIYCASVFVYLEVLAKVKNEDVKECALAWATDVSGKGTVEQRKEFDFAYQRLRVYIQGKLRKQREKQSTSGKTNELSSEVSSLRGASSQAAEESSVSVNASEFPNQQDTQCCHVSHSEPQYQLHPLQSQQVPHIQQQQAYPPQLYSRQQYQLPPQLFSAQPQVQYIQQQQAHPTQLYSRPAPQYQLPFFQNQPGPQYHHAPHSWPQYQLHPQPSSAQQYQ